MIAAVDHIGGMEGLGGTNLDKVGVGDHFKEPYDECRKREHKPKQLINGIYIMHICYYCSSATGY